MAKLLLKKSSVDGNAAGTSDIDHGELAINFRNGRLFYKDNSNNIDNFIDSDLIQARYLGLAGGTLTGNIAFSGSQTVDGVDISARDAILTSTTTTANAALPKAGGTMTGDLSFGDSDKAIFGAGSDLQIYHDGSHSIIEDNGTGAIKVKVGDFRVENASGNNLIKGVGDIASLYHAGSEKLATNSTGVDITGTLTSDGLTVNPTASAEISGEVNGNYILKLDNTHATSGNGLRIETPSTASNEYSLVVKSNNGSNDNLVVSNSGNVGIGTSSPTSYNSKADDLVVLTSGDTGISIISGTSNEGAIAFGDGTSGGSPIMGRVRYDHSANSMDFRVNNAEAMRIDSSGNVTVTGTVDGRDVATDGTKLDGIEASATADQSAAEILTAIKTVDGASSGLDADLLDGQQGSHYRINVYDASGTLLN